MDDKERAAVLLRLLTTAMIVHVHEAHMMSHDEDDIKDMPGIVGGPERPGDPEPEPREKSNDSPDIFSLNKFTDLIQRCLQASTRYFLAKDLNLLHSSQDEGLVEMTPIGVTFNLRFKRNADVDRRRAVEIGAELTQSYHHYRLFENEPSVEEFIRGVDWQGDMTPEEVKTNEPIMELMLRLSVPIMHDRHKDIKALSHRLFDQCLSHLHELSTKRKVENRPSLHELFGVILGKDIQVIKMNLDDL